MEIIAYGVIEDKWYAHFFKQLYGGAVRAIMLTYAYGGWTWLLEDETGFYDMEVNEATENIQRAFLCLTVWFWLLLFKSIGSAPFPT